MIGRSDPSESSRWFNRTSTQPISGTSNHDRIYSPERDDPLDAFDRELLAESSGEVVWEESQDQYRLPLPCPPVTVAAGGRLRHSGDTLLNRTISPSSSSSNTLPISSPTQLALRNKTLRKTRLEHNGNPDGLRMPRNLDTSESWATTTDSRQRTVAVEPWHTTPIVQGISLVETSMLPDSLRSIFDFPIFNAVQSKCFPHAYQGGDNIVLSAPTGSGKTAVMELAICQLLMTQKSEQFKVVYQAPTKSLCNERYRDWTAKFNSLGLRCAELTGDVEYAHLRDVQSANIIIATPEKWDSITRKWKDNMKLVQMIKLFLVDEVHILKESRGATLEAVVSRMKSVGCGVRFIALSATVPNSDDVATWLGLNCDTPERPAIREVFGEDFRPVKLEKHVLGYRTTGNDFVLDSILTKEIPMVIARYAKRKPVMVFCATRKAASKTASVLANLWTVTAPQDRLWSGPKQCIKVTDHELQGFLPAAVAFHHSGLDAADRQAVEAGYLNGQISVICSTSTLAVGVNLPCYLVILKGTVSYTDTGLQEYSGLEIMQMLGRAGRPQFETSACAIILTNQEKVNRYEKLISGHELLESCLHLNLIEHLNAEIGTGTVCDIISAKKWLSSTFLYVRMRKNPEHYQIAGGSAFEDESTLLQNLCDKEVRLLEEARLVEKTHTGLRSTELGDVMARFYVRYETMRIFDSLPRKAKVSEILSAISQAREFCELRWRSGEKSLFKQINKSDNIRYPIQVDIAMPAHKASLITQIELGGLILEKEAAKKHSTQLRQDTIIVLSHFKRLIRCVIDMQIVLGDATTARNALELGRSLAAGVWDNTPIQLKQIGGIGEVAVRKLASAGIKSIDVLSSTEPHRLDLILGKSKPFGSNLLKRLAVFPQLRVAVKEVNRKRQNEKGAEIRIRCNVGFLNDKVPVFFNQKPVYVVFLCETSNGRLLDFRRFSMKRLTNGEDILLTALLAAPTTHISCHVMCDEIAGTHRYAELSLNIPDSWFPVQNVIARVADKQKLPEPSSAKHTSDEFDDEGLADDDFFATEKEATRANVVVEDIDDIVSEKVHTRSSNQCAKRKSSSNSRDGNTQDAKSWPEPTKLANGNWTCQHTCNDDGKACQHRCCRDGVKKPRKRHKASDHRVPIIEESSELVGINQHKKERLNSHSGGKSIADFLKTSSEFRYGLSEDVKDQHRSPLSLVAGSNSSSSHEMYARCEVETAARLDQKPLSKCMATTEHPRTEVGQASTGADDCDEFDFEQFDPVDCDWNTGLPNPTRSLELDNDHIQKSVSPQSPSQRISPPATIAPMVDIEMSAEFRLKSENKHIAGVSSLDKLFFSELGSSPQKESSHLRRDRSVSDSQNKKSYNYRDRDHQTPNPSRVIPTKFDVSSIQLGALSNMVSRPSTSNTALQNSQELAVCSEGVPNPEGKKENRQSYQEDQVRKWEGLNPLLYEEFGDYVELI